MEQNAGIVIIKKFVEDNNQKTFPIKFYNLRKINLFLFSGIFEKIFDKSEKYDKIN